MWLYRGVQSAVFYYATCTPCAMSVDRRKRRKEAARAQRLKEKCDNELVSDQPRPFPQPTPFSTNAGWRDEIALGPGPPTRRGGHRNNQRTNSWTTDQSSQMKKDKSGRLMQPLGDRLNWMRYQREDEPLWGQEVRGSSIGFSGRGRADTNEPAKYYAAQVPPVNDLHPPIVSGPRSRAETRWMLQPPPSARVMAGKERSDMSSYDNAGEFPGDGLSHVTQASSRRNPRANERIGNDTGDGVFDKNVIQQQLPSRPSATRVRGRSDSIGRDDLDISRHSRSDSMFSMANTDDQSLIASWKYPDTPATRPGSKSTDDSEKVYGRPQISKTLSTLQPRGPKNKIHLLHLEINDDMRDEVGLGQLERIRPWRWSMDI
ncbi:uncharacterized protein N7459_007190 [Penicillium hispanicum]|uniref:uncharacterized protein n=1 Tax=Penicillium hispanicum TaxID=1080232 RepID=UPI002540FD7D|nr:uncharacterized protein N7459_007190 [Penicillium hispanicum]KAJ5578226.1 hypothetical protein N7459_007190 [Penicillium hispanicum]